MKNNKTLTRFGYSFVETLAILSILAILVLAAVTTFVNLRAKSRDVSEKAIVASLQTAITQYYSKYMAWPQIDDFDTRPTKLFSLMKYPPLVRDDYYDGDGNETWAIVNNGNGQFAIICPHADIIGYTKGYYWLYYPTGNNTGKILLAGSNGH